MTIASILCVVDGGSGSESALAAAFALGRRFDAYVEVLHVEPDPNDSIPLVGEGMSGAMVEQVMTDLQASADRNAKEARRLFEAQCEALDMAAVDADGRREPVKFTATWCKVVGREDAETARRGLLFDLVVVARPQDSTDGAYAPALEAALFESGLPILVAPPSASATAGKRIAVAWNGSREAARTIRAALPLLASAEEVTVVSLSEDGRQTADPEQLAAYLGTHGIDCRRHVAEAGGGAGAALLAEAEKAGADCLVMGAYGHSRLREFILGGATRSVLTAAPIAVMMSH